MAEEKLIAAGSGGGGGGATGEGGDGAAADPVSAAVVKSLDAKLESIDDLIARLEIEEGEVCEYFLPPTARGTRANTDAYRDLFDYCSGPARKSSLLHSAMLICVVHAYCTSISSLPCLYPNLPLSRLGFPR